MSEHPTTQDFFLDSFEAQFSRIFEVVGCRTQVELAELLEISQASISDAKRRKSIPSGWLVKLFSKKHISPNWLRTGKGDKFMESLHSEMRNHAVKEIITVPKTLNEYTTDELLAEITIRVLKIVG